MGFSNSVKESWNKIRICFYCFATLVLCWKDKADAIKFNVEVKTEILEKSSSEYETMLTARQLLHKVLVIVVLVVVEVVVVIMVIVRLLFWP